MGEVKKLNIKNQTYYFYDDMINIKIFYSNVLKIDKKQHKDIDIYYIGYISIKKFSDCENIHSVNTMYSIIIHSATGYFKAKNGEKHLIIDLTEEYEKVFSGIKSKIRALNGGKELFYEKKHARIGVNTDNDLPLNKPLKFLTLTVITKYIFQGGKKLYPQIHLDECLYEL